MENEINEAHQESKEDSVSKKRKIVVPGEFIVKGEDFLPGDGAKREGDNVIADRYGLAEIAGRMIKVIPLSGAYVPRRGNVVLGRIIDVLFNGWLVDVDSAGNAFLPIDESPRFINRNEMDQFLAIGDVLAAKIWSIKGRGIDLTLKGRGLGKLDGGFVFRINPSRVPRVIGREGSMITLIKEKTGTNITVGQNGWIWIKGDNMDNEIKARNAIEFVADKVHVDGLTDKMEQWFSN